MQTLNRNLSHIWFSFLRDLKILFEIAKTWSFLQRRTKTKLKQMKNFDNDFKFGCNFSGNCARMPKKNFASLKETCFSMRNAKVFKKKISTLLILIQVGILKRNFYQFFFTSTSVLRWFHQIYRNDIFRETPFEPTASFCDFRVHRFSIFVLLPIWVSKMIEFSVNSMRFRSFLANQWKHLR